VTGLRSDLCELPAFAASLFAADGLRRAAPGVRDADAGVHVCGAGGSAGLPLYVCATATDRGPARCLEADAQRSCLSQRDGVPDVYPVRRETGKREQNSAQAPMPSATVKTATAVNPGFFASVRAP